MHNFDFFLLFVKKVQLIIDLLSSLSQQIDFLL